MAGALIGIVKNNLQTFVQEELATIWGVDSQLQKLSKTLNAIHAVLQDAEEKQITSHAIKLWLQNLTDAAHVLDDILDECSIESNRLLFEEQDSGFVQKALIMCLTCCFLPNKIFFRRNIGKRMKEITHRFHNIDEERRMFDLRARIIERQPEDDEWRQTSSVITEPKVYGRDQDREKIVEFLLRHASNNEDLSIYPIVGMAGLGKTTLAQMVFNDDRVSRHFDLKIWVCVSDDFSLKRILQSIIESLTRQNPNLLTLESMQKEVQGLLQSKKYLLVLDDVWNEDQVKWEKLKYLLYCGSVTKGASILVTTRLESVASIMGTDPAHHLLGLSEDDNWLLLKQHAFGPNRPELVAIGKEIVRKCAGSPLASKVLGSLLRFKSEEKQWHSVKESKFWDIAEDNSIMRALRISYFNLKLSLRPCFSFCSIFPKDFEIDKEQLIHLWVANGFVKSRGNLEAEDVGYEVWNELYQRSFFQEVKTDDVSGNVTFKMHDLVHDVAQSIMGEECVVSEVANLTNLSSRVHHIHCLASNQPLNIGAFKKFESLRTFLEFDHSSSNFLALPPISSLRALRINSSYLSALKNLKHLRYLELYGSHIINLPKYICSLQKLQILKLQGCEYLSCLPKHLTMLQDLRHLVIKDCQSLAAMPPNIGKLTRLRTLSTFIVGSKLGFGLAELHDLQLQGKLHIRGLENVSSEWDAKQANMISKKDLNRLYLSWGSKVDSQGTDAEKVLEALQPHSNLKSFGMKGYPGIQLGSWMRNYSILEGLVDLTLFDCKNCQQLPPLGKLPRLTSLYVSGMKDLKYIDDDSYNGVEEKAFKSLKKLTLHWLPNLERMLGDEGVEMLPLLSQFSIRAVPKFRLPCLPSVEHLEAYGRSISAYDYHGKEEVASFPKGIMRSMPRLKTLFIRGFDTLKVLPDELSSLSELQKLLIEFCNELESLPEHVLQGLSSLQYLCISFCKKFKSLSKGVQHLTCLERLDIYLYPDQLVDLPSNMNQLTALRHFAIFGGRQLPQGLELIPSLQSLILCEVDSLPERLGRLTSLQQLGIIDCPKLRSLPSSFRHLTNLHTLSINECPKLEKRCKRGIGEEWQNIAHVPQVELVPPEEDTFCDIIRSAWNGRYLVIPLLIRHVIRELRRDHPDEFDQMVDESRSYGQYSCLDLYRYMIQGIHPIRQTIDNVLIKQ